MTAFKSKLFPPFVSPMQRSQILLKQNDTKAVTTNVLPKVPVTKLHTYMPSLDNPLRSPPFIPNH